MLSGVSSPDITVELSCWIKRRLAERGWSR